MEKLININSLTTQCTPFLALAPHYMGCSVNKYSPHRILYLPTLNFFHVSTLCSALIILTGAVISSDCDWSIGNQSNSSSKIQIDSDRYFNIIRQFYWTRGAYIIVSTVQRNNCFVESSMA